MKKSYENPQELSLWANEADQHGSVDGLAHTQPDCAIGTQYYDRPRAANVARRQARGTLPPPCGGDIIAGRYRILRPIGEGGMGVVYEVAHNKLGKSFALKQIRGERSIDARRHFYREAHYTSAVSHPSFPAVVDFGDDPRFGMYMVSEYVEGVTLAQQLQTEGPMAPDASAPILLEIAQALGHVHDLGLAHGDIKDSNIMITSEASGRRLQVKIIDLGLARSRSLDGGHIAGTPQYLAPEMLEGVYANPQTDIYALGVLSYFVLTGRLPYEGSTHEILSGHRSSHTPAPSEGAISGQASLRCFDTLVRRAMSPTPNERFQSMREYIDSLCDAMDSLGMHNRRRPVDLSRAAVSEVSAPELLTSVAVIAPDSTVLTLTGALAEHLSCSVDNLVGEPLSRSALGRQWPQLLDDIARAAAGEKVRRTVSMSNGDEDVEVHLTLEAMLPSDQVALVVQFAP